MAKYLVKAPTVVSVSPERPTYVDAAPGSPAVINVPDSYVPSRTWEPLDAPAAAALAKLLDCRVEVSEAPAFPAVNRTVSIGADGREVP